WRDLQSVSDTDKDNKITQAEWLFYHEAVIGFTEIYRRIIRRSVQELFDIFDLDKDGKISRDEFAIFYKAYGLDEDIATNIFCRLDVNVNDRISKESFLNLFDQFYRSDNPHDLGNALFGELNDNYQ
ncbi:MAG: EF-hand domain-containing protein, partial [Kiloniellales bacterium]|nr:EF-hand domain-containing protein [Kiloniellales bacterium]